MHVLVTAASRHDATREIAEAIADGLNRRGVDAEARPVDQVTSLDGFDAAVIGSAIYMGRWLQTARLFAAQHATALAAMPVWLFSSGPVGPADKRSRKATPPTSTRWSRSPGAGASRVRRAAGRRRARRRRARGQP